LKDNFHCFNIKVKFYKDTTYSEEQFLILDPLQIQLRLWIKNSLIYNLPWFLGALNNYKILKKFSIILFCELLFFKIVLWYIFDKNYFQSMFSTWEWHTREEKTQTITYKKKKFRREYDFFSVAQKDCLFLSTCSVVMQISPITSAAFSS
jgi:hypothetical protein